MRKALLALVAALGLLLAFPVAAAADHNEASWTANQDSHIVDETTVHLEGDNTSIETHDLDLNLKVGDEVSYDYELFEGATCEAGSPRVFVQPNGNTNHGGICAGDGSPDSPRSVTFAVSDAGLLDGAGLVYAGDGEGDYVEISNLVIAGEPIHFTNPEPEPEPTDEPDPDPTETSEPTSEPSSEPTEDDSTDEPESTTTDDTAPASSQETLPDTGVSPLLLVGGGLALVLVGGAAMLRSRRAE